MDKISINIIRKEKETFIVAYWSIDYKYLCSIKHELTYTKNQRFTVHKASECPISLPRTLKPSTRNAYVTGPFSTPCYRKKIY